ncbi:MAG: sulfur transferase domain-containing protein [Rhodothermales bacterium]
MKHHIKHLIYVAFIILVSACVSPHLSTVAIEEAAPLQGWGDINNLFQDKNFFFSGQPDSTAFERLAEEAGIKTVISFRRPQEMEKLDFDEPALMETLDLRFINIPVMPDTFSKKDADRLAEVLAETKGPVLLHCSSSNRAGGVWATYLVRHRGIELEEALRLGRAAGLSSDSMIEAVRRVAGEAL